MKDQTLSTSTAYAQLPTAALGVEFARDESHLNGSFGTKKVKNTTQWYFSFRDSDQRVRQRYVGPVTPAILELVQKRGPPSRGNVSGRLHAPPRHLAARQWSAST